MIRCPAPLVLLALGCTPDAPLPPPRPARGDDPSVGPPPRALRSAPADDGRDDLFVTEDGGDLDLYTCGTGSTITVDVLVDRVVSRSKAGWSEILERDPTLRLRVYDVDESDPDCPEVDTVSINGRRVGRLSGANDAWSEFTASLPVSWFEDGTIRDATYVGLGAPPVPGRNTVTVAVDTGGCTFREPPETAIRWCVEVDRAEIEIDAPRPVALFHGILSSGATWDPVVGRVPGGNVEAFDLVPPNAPIAAHAVQVSHELSRTATAYGTRKVDVVAHSKGGLDASAGSLLLPNGVGHLVTLATPHLGSELADHLLESHADVLELVSQLGSVEVATELGSFARMVDPTLANAEHRSFYAGTPMDPSSVGCPLHPASAPALPFESAHDGLVACERASPLGLALTSTGPHTHVDLTGNPTVWDWAWDRLRGRIPPPASCLPRVDGRSRIPSTAVLRWSSVRIGAGGAVALAFRVDDTVDRLVARVVTDDPDATIALVDPGGRRLEAEGTAVDGGVDLAGLAVEAPRVGEWRAEIAAGVGGRFVLAAEATTELTLEVETSAVGGAVEGDPVEVSATLDRSGAGVSGAELALLLTDADSGAIVDVPLEEAGGGAYVGEWIARAGTWTGQVRAEGETDGEPFERARGLVVVVGPDAAVLGRPSSDRGVDRDGDGRWDALEVHVPVAAHADAELFLVGSLAGPDGGHLVSAAASGSVAADEDAVLTLAFDGEALQRARVDGPYELVGLTLLEVAGGTVQDVREAPWTTGSYAWWSFDGPALSLTATGDLARDADADGAIDAVEVELTVDVVPGFEGAYAYSALLRDALGEDVEWQAVPSRWLPSGASTIGFAFAADVLLDHPSPYTLTGFSLAAVSDPGLRLSEAAAHVTLPYCACDLEGASADCVEPDADGDGFPVCGGDCDDDDARVSPAAIEACNGIDDDCSGAADEPFDTDLDGVATCEGDCDDAAYFVHPEALDVCNDLDDDCDGLADPACEAPVDDGGPAPDDAVPAPPQGCGCASGGGAHALLALLTAVLPRRFSRRSR